MPRSSHVTYTQININYQYHKVVGMTLSLTLPDPVTAEEVNCITDIWFRFAEERFLVDITKEVQKNFQFQNYFCRPLGFLPHLV